MFLNKKPTEEWDMLWVNARLATMSGEGYGIVEGGAVGIKDGRITYAWEEKKFSDSPKKLAKKVIDAKGRWITPGLIDCHTHLVYGGNRAREFEQRLEGASYEEIAKAGGGILSTVRATRSASEDELLEQSAPRLRSLVTGGVTTIEIKSGYGLTLEDELKMLRAAKKLEQLYPVTVSPTFLGAHALPPEFESADAYVDHLCKVMIPAVAMENLAEALDAYLERIAFTHAHVERLFKAAREHGLKLKVHAGQFSDMQGAELAAKYGALSVDHLEYASDEAVTAMGAAGTVAVLLPGAFFVLQEKQKPPVEALRSAGVPMAVATDCNPGTSPVTSLLLMLNMACVQFRLTPAEALAGVTKHAAKALGRASELGTLDTGKAADLAIWDIEHPAELSYRLGHNPCVGVVKNGIYHAF